MTKKILAIDLDEVIRSKWLQFDRFYAQEFGEDGIQMPFDTYNLRNHYKFLETIETVNYLNEELPEDISATEYIVDKETGIAPVDHLAFRKRDEKMTADEAFNKFLYQDFLVEIFSSAPVLYRGLDLDLRKFKLAFENDVDIMLFSSEKNESISPSLFFISKLRPIIRMFYFPETPEKIWDIADVVITTDPAIVSSKPNSDHKVVLLNRPHNENIEGDLKTMNFIDLVENPTFKEMIK